MAKFKCIVTGEVYEFVTEHDIAGMRLHSEYEEVHEVVEEVVEEKAKEKKPASTGE